MKLSAIHRLLWITLFLAWCGSDAHGQILISNFASAYTQNFDTLASTGTSSVVPSGWAFSESGTSSAVNGLYTAGTGSSTTGDTYSFGSTGSGERALGELSSGTFASTFGAQFKNSGTTSITSITLSYMGEQWRHGSNAADKIDFQISFNATSLTSGTWTDINSLDFSVVNSTTNNTSLNGNLAANRQLKSVTNFVLGSSVAPNATFWIRWVGADVSGNDAGLAVDDFSISAIPEPSMYLVACAAVLALLLYVRRKRFLRTASVGV